MESKASFAENIAGKFDLIAQRVQQESRSLKVISAYFQNVQKELERFGKGLLKALGPIKQLQQGKDSLDSWGYALRAVVASSEDYAKLIMSTCTRYTTEITEPFEIFIGHYEQSNKASLKECGKVLEVIGQERVKVRKSRDKYAKAVKGLVAAEPQEVKEHAKTMNETRDKYSQHIAVLNSYIGDKEGFYKKKLELLQQNEETRIEFLRKHFVNFFCVSESLAKAYIEMHAGVQKVLEIVNPIGDLQLFVTSAARGQKTSLFEKAAFEVPEESQQPPARHMSDAETYGSTGTLKPPQTAQSEGAASDREVEIPEVPEETENIMALAWTKLVSSQPLESPEKLQLLDIIKSPTCCERMVSIIQRQMRKQQLTSLDALVRMAGVVNPILTQIEKAKGLAVQEFAVMLELANQIYAVRPGPSEEKPTMYLRELVLGHGVWKSRDMWAAVVKQRVAKSLGQVETAMHERKGQEKSGLMKTVLGVGAKLFTPKDKLLQETEAKAARAETGKRAVIYSDLQVFASEMSLMGVDPDMCREIFIQSCIAYKIDRDKLYQLLVDYHCAQRVPRIENVPVGERKALMISQSEARQAKYFPIGKPAALILRLAFLFLSDARTLRTLLVLSKPWHARFRRLIYRQALTMSAVRRPGIWCAIFQTKGLAQIYTKLKEEKMKMFQATNKPVEEVIQLDVQRSFHMHDEKTQEAMMNILRCYAIHNPEVEYCQGMNFIAGLLYLMYHDEAAAFSVLSSLITTHGLSNLYKQDVPLLRMYLYQMNRLLAIYLPRLHVHLLEEGITAAYFCSPWFLTAFTFVLQHAKTTAVPFLLLSIFDRFLLVRFDSPRYRTDTRRSSRLRCSSWRTLRRSSSA